MEDFNIAYLAKLSNLSESHFRKTFKDLTSFSPAKYRNRLRIEQAVGSNDQLYFSRLFKQFTGFSPSKFKNGVI